MKRLAKNKLIKFWSPFSSALTNHQTTAKRPPVSACSREWNPLTALAFPGHRILVKVAFRRPDCASKHSPLYYQSSTASLNDFETVRSAGTFEAIDFAIQLHRLRL
jgi:hypothetical protein